MSGTYRTNYKVIPQLTKVIPQLTKVIPQLTKVISHLNYIELNKQHI